MVFEALNDSLQRGELLLWHGGMCRYHLRRDGQVTIHELMVLPAFRRGGIGRRMIRHLTFEPGVRCIVARCPTDLESNRFWEALGFEKTATETLKSGRQVNVWRLAVSGTSTATAATSGRRNLRVISAGHSAFAATKPSTPALDL